MPSGICSTMVILLWQYLIYLKKSMTFVKLFQNKWHLVLISIVFSLDHKEMFLNSSPIFFYILNCWCNPHRLVHWANAAYTYVWFRFAECLPHIMFSCPIPKVTKITSDLFIHFGQLTRLDMRENRVTSLGDYVFSNLQSLTHLNLRKNMISSIAVHSFYGLLLLKYLNLNANRITAINLEDIPIGAKVCLEYNSITSISKITSRPTSTHSMYEYHVMKERQMITGKIIFSSLIHMQPATFSRRKTYELCICMWTVSFSQSCRHGHLGFEWY